MRKREAEEAAKELLAKMDGKGWKIDVYPDRWKNNYNYAVVNDNVAVRPGYGVGANTATKAYQAYINRTSAPDHRTSNGWYMWDNDGREYSNPNRAVKAIIHSARSYVDKLNTTVKSAESIL
jgi:hypothetical protein